MLWQKVFPHVSSQSLSLHNKNKQMSLREWTVLLFWAYDDEIFWEMNGMLTPSPAPFLQCRWKDPIISDNWCWGLWRASFNQHCSAHSRDVIHAHFNIQHGWQGLDTQPNGYIIF